MTIKLEEKTIELGGKLYVLHANMSVLERVQEYHDGELGQFMKTNANVAKAEILSAMLNDWSEDQGWEQDWTPKKVKKYFTVAMLNDLDVVGMFFRAMTPAAMAEKEKARRAEAKKAEEETEPEKSGN